MPQADRAKAPSSGRRNRRNWRRIVMEHPLACFAHGNRRLWNPSQRPMLFPIAIGTRGFAMGLISEFKTFINRGNVIDLAVGVIIGGAFATITKSVTDDLIMPENGRESCRERVCQTV